MIINLSINSFVDPFVDIALTCFDSHVIRFYLMYHLFRLLSKSVLFMKLAISFLLAKCGRFNLKSKISFAKLLNSGVVIYLS